MGRQNVHERCCGKREPGGDCITNANPWLKAGKAPWWTVEADSRDAAKFATRDDADLFADLLRSLGRTGVMVRG